MNKVYGLIGRVISLIQPVEEDERGLSQSTENAILLAGAVVVAGIVVAAIKAFVESRLPS